MSSNLYGNIEELYIIITSIVQYISMVCTYLIFLIKLTKPVIFWYRKNLKVAIFWDGCGNNFDGYYIRCFFFPCVIYSYGSLSVIAATTACNKLEPGRGRASEHGLQQHVATVVAASTYSTTTRSAILTVQMYTDLCWLFRDCCAQRSQKFSGVGLRGLLLLLLHIEKGRVMGYCTGAVETSMFFFWKE